MMHQHVAQQVGPGEVAAMLLWAAAILGVCVAVKRVCQAYFDEGDASGPGRDRSIDWATEDELRDLFSWDDDATLPARIATRSGEWVRDVNHAGSIYRYVSSEPVD